MTAREISVELLLNRRVYARDGRVVGHVEDVCAQRSGDAWRVVEYHVGAFALFERLGAWPLGRDMLHALGLRRRGGGYRVPWNLMDLADPLHPRLRCEVSELDPLDET